MSEEKYILDPEETAHEKALEKSLEEGEWASVQDVEELKKELVAAARLTSLKRTAISIRLPEADLRKLKVKAEKEGLPYQTLIASILHKSVA